MAGAHFPARGPEADLFGLLDRLFETGLERDSAGTGTPGLEMTRTFRDGPTLR